MTFIENFEKLIERIYKRFQETKPINPDELKENEKG